MHTEERFKKLLDSYLDGTCSPEEKRILEEWFDKGGDTGKPDGALSPAEQRALLERIHRRTAPRRVISLPVRWVAAALSTGLVLTAGLWIQQQKRIAPEPDFITVTTGKGQVKKITLPDHSTVCINALSTLSYHPDFTGHREVRLSGEALFDVSQDRQHPFRVSTEDSTHIVVLGTLFNINSRRGSRETDISVITGKIEVSRKGSLILTQKQAARFDRNSGQLTLAEDLPADAAAWTKGEWVYNNLYVRDLAVLLEAQYGVTIRNDHSKGEGLQTGMSVNFNSRQKADDIVSTFCALAGCRYRQPSPAVFEIY